MTHKPPPNVNRSLRIPIANSGSWVRRRWDGASRAKGERKDPTFNVDVRPRKRQDLKHRFHLVPLASSVEEGLSFDQNTHTHNGQTHTHKKREEAEEMRSIQNQGVPGCPAHCPSPIGEHINKMPLKFPQTPEDKNVTE